MSPKKIILFSLLLLLILGLIAAYGLWRNRFGVPEDFASEVDHFKYGSIGSDNLTRGLPYWIWKVLPELFPDLLPRRTGTGGYEAFGLIVEPGKDRPIGFSKRTIWNYIDFVGPNCAFCHVSTIRRTADGAPETVLGMPANTVDIEKFFLFLFKTANDPRFTVNNVMKQVETQVEKEGKKWDFFDRLAYRLLIYVYKREVLCLAREFDFLNHMTEFGPGRVETWTPYKRTLLVPALPVSVAGITDFPALWNQDVRERRELHLHWDGNNDVLLVRNLIAASGVVGRDLEALDFPRLERITTYIKGLRPPKYEDMIPKNREDLRINQELVEKGRDIYQRYCFECHEPEGKKFDKVVPVEEIGTDRNRVDAFTPELAHELNKVGTASWKLHNFEKTNGYVSTLLDGIWLRAPYLHNGSVPTLKDLLSKHRPKDIFYRGNDVYDWEKVGFKSDVSEENGRMFFPYDPKLEANNNGGHRYGTELPEDEKKALIEYLKTL